ncbi:hypothetical protein [Paractinoplanes toevensis]|uniref:Uncharacterized protein n=1 Tax=Paractinoplanes toevensis TaxID=571911 RepID=A0A919W7D8_9ACTN|nr:hypothetical protein [Actinoplanes toevensis]GIM94893.1 hypothetical protein Ato02nite_066860 [Actinoplanes toevensis]
MADDAIAQEMIDMTDEDRRLQPGAHSGDFTAQLAHRKVTVRNGDRLTEIIAEHGWPARRSTARRSPASSTAPPSRGPAKTRSGWISGVRKPDWTRSRSTSPNTRRPDPP